MHAKSRGQGADVLSLLIGLRVIDGMHEGEVQAEEDGDDGEGSSHYEREVVEGEGTEEQLFGARLNWVG